MPRHDAIRDANIAVAQKGGFAPATWLPLPSARELCPGTLRPVKEIASRLMALDSLFTWVAFDSESARSEQIIEYQKRSSLCDFLTDEEKGIILLPREQANEQHSHNIGWKLENMWALAWVLGMPHEPSHRGGEIPHKISKEIIYDFLPGLGKSVSDLLGQSTPRSEAEVCSLEDLFYLVHNAARSAQLGAKKKTVPDGFNPIVDAGAIHERRHSLSWCLSPGVAWDETDLST